MTIKEFDRALADRVRAGEPLESIAESTGLPVPVVLKCVRAATRHWSRTRLERQTIYDRFAAGDSVLTIAVALELTVPLVEDMLRTEIRARRRPAA